MKKDKKDIIRKEYENNDISLKALSDKHGVKLNTIKSWKNRDKLRGNEWIKEGATNQKRVATYREKKRIERAAESVANIDDGTDRQKLYIIYRGMGMNVVQAALKAGYTKASAYSTCYEMDKSPAIRNKIKKFQQIRYEGIIQTEKDVLLQYFRIANADLGDYIEQSGDHIKLKDLEKCDTAVIKELTIVKGYNKTTDEETTTTKLKLESKHPALRALGEHYKLFRSDNNEEKTDNQSKAIEDLKGIISKRFDGENDDS